MTAFIPLGDMNDLPGPLIIVEGIDGSGKSTQLSLLRKWLLSQGYCTNYTEWNSSPLVRTTTRLGKAQRLLSPMSFCLIHAADFADRLERTILPPMQAGAIALSDRYIYTAFARDAARGIDPDYVRRLYAFAPRPTVAVYFRVPLDVALHRILSSRPELKFYEAGMDLGLSEDPYRSFELFQSRILEQYERTVTEYGLAVVDATLPIAEQQEQFRQLVRPHIGRVMRTEPMPLAEVSLRERLAGRYISDTSSSWVGQ